MKGKTSLLPGEALQAHQVDVFEKKCVVTTNCKESAEVIVLGKEKKDLGRTEQL